MRGFIEELLEQELTAALGGRSKHERAVEHHQGYRNGTRERHAPDALHDEVSADYTDMIYARRPRRCSSAVGRSCANGGCDVRPWRPACRKQASACSAFLRLPPSQWRSARTTNAIERLHKEFRRRIKTQTVLPSAETAAMLFWALLASVQITMREVDGWQTLAELPAAALPLDLAA